MSTSPFKAEHGARQEVRNRWICTITSKEEAPLRIGPMDQETFNRLWRPEHLPACPVGMALLRRWAEATPGALNFVHLTQIDVLEDVPYSAEPQWKAFAEHRAHCEVCRRV